jgi:hypothetical protein
VFRGPWCQTYGLLAKEAKFFGFSEMLNLDAEEATEQCVSPLTFTERFFAKTILTPVLILGGILAAIPTWQYLRGLRPLQKLWHKLMAPEKIDRIMIKRAFLNAFLFCFAPLTRGAVETLVCTDPSGTGLQFVLAFDMSVTCYEGSHLGAFYVAVLVLMIMSIAIPTALLRKVCVLVNHVPVIPPHPSVMTQVELSLSLG